MSGMFVTFEGPDGSGKSTIADCIRARFERQGTDVVFTREPGGTPIAEKIRSIILDAENSAMSARCEALLYAASRAQHTDERIRPCVEAGKLVISDRYVLSSIAYQGWGRALGIDEVAAINRFATGGMRPDLVLFFDVDPIHVLARKAKVVEQDRLEEAGDDFHRRVYEGYRRALTTADHIVMIDARQSIEAVTEQVWQAISTAWEAKR